MKVIVSFLLENTTSSELQFGSNAAGSSYSFSHAMTFRGSGSLERSFLLPTERMRTRRHCSWRLSQHWNIHTKLSLVAEKKFTKNKSRRNNFCFDFYLLLFFHCVTSRKGLVPKFSNKMAPSRVYCKGFARVFFVD